MESIFIRVNVKQLKCSPKLKIPHIEKKPNALVSVKHFRKQVTNK